MITGIKSMDLVTPAAAPIFTKAGSWPNLSSSMLFRGHERSDLFDCVEMIDACLVCLDGDSELVFQIRDKLERADRVENASRDECASQHRP
jgi:hypothetical protein